MVNFYYSICAAVALSEVEAWSFSQTSDYARGTGSMAELRPISDNYINSYRANRVAAASPENMKFPERRSYWKNVRSQDWNPNRRPTSVWSTPSYAQPKPQAPVPAQATRSIPSMRPMPGTNWNRPAYRPFQMQPSRMESKIYNWRPAVPSMRPLPWSNWFSNFQQPTWGVPDFRVNEPAKPVEYVPTQPQGVQFSQLLNQADETPTATELEQELQNSSEIVASAEAAVNSIMDEVQTIQQQVDQLFEMPIEELSLPEVTDQIESVIENVEEEFSLLEDQLDVLETVEEELEYEEDLIEQEEVEVEEDLVN